ncbi:unnamed protein product, partial [Effrenium voratum]
MAVPAVKKQRLSSEDASVKHPDIDKLIQAMAEVRSRTAACRRLAGIAEIESQQKFILDAGAVARGAAMLRGAAGAKGAAVQLLQALGPMARKECVSQPGIAQMLAEVLRDTRVEADARLSAGALLAALLFAFPRLAAAEGAPFAHPAAALLRGGDERGAEVGAKALAALAAVPALRSQIADLGAVPDLARALLLPQAARWAALALCHLAQGDPRLVGHKELHEGIRMIHVVHVVHVAFFWRSNSTSHPPKAPAVDALVALVRRQALALGGEESQCAAAAAAVEALGHLELAKPALQALQLLAEAPEASSDAAEYCRAAAAKVLRKHRENKPEAASAANLAAG